MFYCCNLFYFVLFKSTVLHCIPFYFYCYLTFCNIFCSILLYSIMFWFVPFYSRVLYSILLASSSALSAFYSYSVLLLYCTTLCTLYNIFYFAGMSFCTITFNSIIFHFILLLNSISPFYFILLLYSYVFCFTLILYLFY